MKECNCICHTGYWKESLSNCIPCKGKDCLSEKRQQESKFCTCICHKTICKEPLTHCMKCSKNDHTAQALTRQKEVKSKKLINKQCSCDNAKETCADCLDNNYEKLKEKEKIKRERNMVGCEAIGYKIACGGEICWAHIMTRRYKALKSSKNNRVWVCKNHEIYFNTEGKHEWDVFVMTRFPERWNFILKKYTEGSEANKIIKEHFKV